MTQKWLFLRASAINVELLLNSINRHVLYYLFSVFIFWIIRIYLPYWSNTMTNVAVFISCFVFSWLFVQLHRFVNWRNSFNVHMQNVCLVQFNLNTLLFPLRIDLRRVFRNWKVCSNVIRIPYVECQWWHPHTFKW